MFSKMVSAPFNRVHLVFENRIKNYVCFDWTLESCFYIHPPVYASKIAPFASMQGILRHEVPMLWGLQGIHIGDRVTRAACSRCGQTLSSRVFRLGEFGGQKSFDQNPSDPSFLLRWFWITPQVWRGAPSWVQKPLSMTISSIQNGEDMICPNGCVLFRGPCDPDGGQVLPSDRTIPIITASARFLLGLYSSFLTCQHTYGSLSPGKRTLARSDRDEIECLSCSRNLTFGNELRP